MNITFLTSPTEEQREMAADLIDEGKQLAGKLDRKRFARSCVIVVAVDAKGKVVGTGAVKERRGPVAETGYLVTHPDHLRKGIAAEMTRLRIEAARAAGLDMLFTNVRHDNHPSIQNLLKVGFLFWGNYLSAYETGHVISWYYFPFKPVAQCSRHLETLTRTLTKVS